MKVKIKNKELEDLYLSLMGDNHMINLGQEDCMFLEKEYGNAVCCYRNYLTRPYITTSDLEFDFFISILLVMAYHFIWTSMLLLYLKSVEC